MFPDYGLLNDLLWSDPADTSADWEITSVGIVLFRRAVINEFLQRHDFDLVCRAHNGRRMVMNFFNERTLVRCLVRRILWRVDNWGLFNEC
jgi:serine/threonine-protein phosphatase PP1 catalytic subunit